MLYLSAMETKRYGVVSSLQFAVCIH